MEDTIIVMYWGFQWVKLGKNMRESNCFKVMLYVLVESGVSLMVIINLIQTSGTEVFRLGQGDLIWHFKLNRKTNEP